jgi:RNA polymerase sigma-70 factor (ECF subfamily)
MSDELKHNLSDAELVAKTLANREHYYWLVNRYEQPLKRYISRITNLDPADIEDVLQDVFLKAYLNLNGFDQSLKFSSWIYRIAHNEVISNHRKRQARGIDQQASLDDWQHLVSGLAADMALQQKMTAEQVRQILDKMDLKYREVLELKYLEEKEYAEISDILQKPMGTIATLLSRAKKQFKDLAGGLIPG